MRIVQDRFANPNRGGDFMHTKTLSTITVAVSPISRAMASGGGSHCGGGSGGNNYGSGGSGCASGSCGPGCGGSCCK